MIDYYLGSHRPQSHIFNCRMIISQPAPKQRLSLPNWIPGSYMIRDYAKHVILIQAFVGQDAVNQEIGQEIALQKINSNTWECDNHNADETLIIVYTVYAWDPSVRGAHLDAYHGFVNGCCVFLKAQGKENQACSVTLLRPEIEEASDWQVATTLMPDKASGACAWGFGRYLAQDYEDLIDHPIEMGNFERVSFTVADVPHHIVVSGQHDGDVKRLSMDVAKICATHIALFQTPAPFKQYLFLLTVSKTGYGGLEHKDCSALLDQRDALPVVGDPSQSPAYIGLLALFSHEYFHAWNIKRIKPVAFSPYDHDHKNYTNQLWFFEGVTSYYDDLALVRAQVISPEQYVEGLSKLLTRYSRNGGRKVQTLAESSFDAWIKFYQPNENSINATVNYYHKGAIVALCVDLALRQQGASLDEVMRYLWQHYGLPEEGIPEGEIEKIINNHSQGTLGEWLKKALYTTQTLVLDDLLSQVGIALRDVYSVLEEDIVGNKLGCSLTKTQNSIFIAQIFEGGAACLAGLSAQDELVAINGLKVDAESYIKIIKRLKGQETIRVDFFRQDSLKNLSMTVQMPVPDTLEMTLLPLEEQTPAQRRQAWLYG